MSKPPDNLKDHVDAYTRAVLFCCRWAVEVLACLAIVAALHISIWWATPLALGAAALDSRIFKA